MARTKMVDGKTVQLTPAEEAALDAEAAKYEKTERPKMVLSAIQAEAERRINEGILINGLPFKCNNDSLMRVSGMLTAAREAEAANLPYTQTFRTSAGSMVTVNGSAEVLPIFLAASGFVGTVLKTSATLQGQVAAMTPAQLAAFDAADPAHWL